MSIKKTVDYEIFVRAFKKATEITGLSQKAIAIKMGNRPSSVNIYATGKTEPGLTVMVNIANAFGYDLLDFLALGCDDTQLGSKLIELQQEATSLEAKLDKVKKHLIAALTEVESKPTK